MYLVLTGVKEDRERERELLMFLCAVCCVLCAVCWVVFVPLCDEELSVCN